jgi:hypothetical protein
MLDLAPPGCYTQLTVALACNIQDLLPKPGTDTHTFMHASDHVCTPEAFNHISPTRFNKATTDSSPSALSISGVLSTTPN